MLLFVMREIKDFFSTLERSNESISLLWVVEIDRDVLCTCLEPKTLWAFIKEVGDGLLVTLGRTIL